MEDKYAGLCFQTLLELLHKVPVANIESGIQCKVREHVIVQNFSLWVAGLHRAEIYASCQLIKCVLKLIQINFVCKMECFFYSFRFSSAV